jgi:hypothetical protein
MTERGVARQCGSTEEPALQCVGLAVRVRHRLLSRVQWEVARSRGGTKPGVCDVQMNGSGAAIGGRRRPRAAPDRRECLDSGQLDRHDVVSRHEADGWPVVTRERERVRAVRRRMIRWEQSHPAPRYLQCQLARDLPRRPHREGGPGYSQGNVRHPRSDGAEDIDSSVGRRRGEEQGSLTGGSVVGDLAIAFAFTASGATGRSKGGIERLRTG